jgi:hypothetical protein
MISHGMSAISHPAKTPRSITTQKPPSCSAALRLASLSLIALI